MPNKSLLGLLGVLAVFVSACAVEKPATLPPRASLPPTIELGRRSDLVVVIAQKGDTPAALAQRYLSDASLAYRVRPLRDPDGLSPALQLGEPVAIFLKAVNPGGTLGHPMQRVPILCYHRFTVREKTSSKMEVSASAFEAQMRFLLLHDYQPISLDRLEDFLEGQGDLPPKAVVLTIDDGYKSAYSVAFPVIKKYNIPITLFVYSDFLGTGDGLSWAQLQQMSQTGLVDVEAHSQTHSDLTLRARGESAAAYQRRIDQELNSPRTLISAHLGKTPRVFAFPYGAANAAMLVEMKRSDWSLGLTVLRGGNPSWSEPLLLRRDMVYGTDSLEEFSHRLQSSASEAAHP